LLDTGIAHIAKQETALVRRFVDGLMQIEGIELYGDVHAAQKLPIVALNIKGKSSGEVATTLWESHQICVRAGSHCAPLLHKHFGTVGRGIVRFSFCHFNTPAEIDTALAALEEIACSA
ncbi:MAG: aminotransferase class V-fold PLP-dependent enzyme, partial [Coriobacteriales bacterium]|nr:aminotransferase class V-fold PLP-dependent enzyme [Coriobacteriales bacterium]